MDKLPAYLLEITENVASAERHLVALDDWTAKLEAAGMYPAIPSEQWQTRNGGETQYLYMIFRLNRDGSYAGPDGKRKLYVGCKDEAIAEARRLTANRRLYETLADIRQRLARWLREKEEEIKYLANRSSQYPKHHEQLKIKKLLDYVNNQQEEGA